MHSSATQSFHYEINRLQQLVRSKRTSVNHSIRQNQPREHCSQRHRLHAQSPTGHSTSTHEYRDRPFTLICDITWENGENYIKSRFKFVFTVERKLKENLSL